MQGHTRHHGGCHCGSVRYQVELDLSAPAITCNCSMCGRSGSMLQFVPADKFTLEKGEDQLTNYQFNKQVIHHVFCKRCGIKPFARGKNQKGEPTVAINVRTIDEVDVFKIPTTQFEGKNH
jgi:hypothetical protein